jgi:acyl carrier protein
MGLEIAEIMMDIEDAFGVRLEESAAFDGTVGGLCAWVQRGLPADTLPKERIRERVVAIIADRLGLAAEQITDGMHLVRDLNAG